MNACRSSPYLLLVFCFGKGRQREDVEISITFGGSCVALCDHVKRFKLLATFYHYTVPSRGVSRVTSCRKVLHAVWIHIRLEHLVYPVGVQLPRLPSKCLRLFRTLIWITRDTLCHVVLHRTKGAASLKQLRYRMTQLSRRQRGAES